jgi:hypothetical protein
MNDLAALSWGESYVDPATVNGTDVPVATPGASAPASNGWDTWLQARLGNAIDVSVDRVVNQPQTLTGTQAYGIDPVTGRTYLLGQPNLATVQTLGAPGNGQVSGGLLLVGLILLLLVLHPGHL